jgi:hypothetical protein
MGFLSVAGNEWASLVPMVIDLPVSLAIFFPAAFVTPTTDLGYRILNGATWGAVILIGGAWQYAVWSGVSYLLKEKSSSTAAPNPPKRGGSTQR